MFTRQRISIVTTCFHKFLVEWTTSKMLKQHWIVHNDKKFTPWYDSTPVCIVVENIVGQSHVIVATVYQNFVEQTASSAFKQQNFILVLICNFVQDITWVLVIVSSSVVHISTKILVRGILLQFEAIMVLTCAFTYFWFPSHFVHIQLSHKRAKDCCCQVNHRSLS